MTDDDLRTLLHGAVEDVHPQPDLEDVRARSRRPRHHWGAVVVAAAAVVVVVIGGSVWLAERSERQPSPATAKPQPAVDSSPSAAPTRTAQVPVYYVGEMPDGPRLFSEQHRVQTSGTDLQAAVEEAVKGRPLDRDYVGDPLGTSTTVTATQGSDAITLDLHGYDDTGLNLSGEDQQVALQALVWTADAATGTQLPVRFLLDGQPTDSVLSTDTTQPVERSSADSTLALVSIDSPAQGATVPGTFEVRGHASAFEADVVWELKQGDVTVRHGFTTAAECCTLSPYSFTVTAPAGDYTLVVHDTDESGGAESKGVNTDTKDVTVR